MYDHSPAAELRHAMAAARAHKFIAEPETAPVKFIGHIEDVIDRAFNSAVGAEHTQSEQAVHKAEHAFHEALGKLVKARLYELKHAAPLEDMEVAFNEFIDSMNRLSTLLPKGEMPDALTVRTETHKMLDEMEFNIRHSVQRSEEKLERLGSAAQRAKMPEWLATAPAEGNADPRNNRVLRDTGESIAAAKKSRAAYCCLKDFKFLMSADSWLENLQLLADLQRSQLRAQNNAEKSQFLSDKLELLNEDLLTFCRSAADDQGDDISLAHLGAMFVSITETVAQVRDMLPESARETIPSPEQFAKHQDRLLLKVRQAIHPRINNATDPDERGRAG